MGKQPNKVKRVNADALHNKKSSESTITKKINPFEIHQNKEKFKILGRTCKHDHGLPGVSRSKALKKRKETLGVEYETHYKTNKFMDKRIGRGFNVMSEELANARFAANKVDQMKRNRKDLFNLNDTEVLTHRGETLAEIEQFRDMHSDESGDEGLDEQYTGVAHFGGGADDHTDRKAAIDDMILEAKRKKAEVAKDKDELYNMTTQLDESYKNIMPLMAKLVKTDVDRKGPLEDYDRIMREMIFQPRGAVTDKLQSQEELAKKEKERLEMLENERLARMRGEELGEAKPKHRSADDLDDGYLIGSESEEEGTLAYDLNGMQPNDDTADNELEDENMSDVELEAGNESDTENSEESENDDSADNDDNLSDLKISDSESEDDEQNKSANRVKLNTKNNKVKMNLNEDFRIKAGKELPYTYEMPSSYKEFSELVCEQHPDYQTVIVERIIKCNHPKLDGSNREKMNLLFGYIVEFIFEIFDQSDAENIEICFKTYDRLLPHLFDLIQLNSEKMSEQMIEIIKKKYSEYKKQSKNCPPLSTVIMLKIVSTLFSCSDFRHPVVTPCFIFISHILSRFIVRTRRDISTGLLIVTVALELTQLSRRFLPSVFNFLLGIIFLAIQKRPIEMVKIVPPFESSGPLANLLVLDSDAKSFSNIPENKLQANDLIIPTIDEKYKILALNTVLKLLKDGIEIVGDNVGVGYIAEPFTNMLDRLNLQKYPNFVIVNCDSVKETLLAAQSKTLHKLVPIVRKPKALRLMEPRIERVYDDKRRPKMSKEKEMRAIMTHKLKRETKGAVREIRRDTDFLQNIKIRKQLENDMERKEKVRQIYAEASVQQGELNELSRQKNKKTKF